MRVTCCLAATLLCASLVLSVEPTTTESIKEGGIVMLDAGSEGEWIIDPRLDDSLSLSSDRKLAIQLDGSGTYFVHHVAIASGKLSVKQYVLRVSPRVEKSIPVIPVPTETRAGTRQKPRLTMRTQEGCIYCEKFKAEVLPSIAHLVEFREVYGGANLYPTFELQVGNRRTTLDGYQTVQQMQATIASMTKKDI